MRSGSGHKVRVMPGVRVMSGVRVHARVPGTPPPLPRYTLSLYLPVYRSSCSAVCAGTEKASPALGAEVGVPRYTKDCSTK